MRTEKRKWNFKKPTKAEMVGFIALITLLVYEIGMIIRDKLIY